MTIFSFSVVCLTSTWLLFLIGAKLGESIKAKICMRSIIDDPEIIAGVPLDHSVIIYNRKEYERFCKGETEYYSCLMKSKIGYYVGKGKESNPITLWIQPSLRCQDNKVSPYNILCRKEYKVMMDMVGFTKL